MQLCLFPEAQQPRQRYLIEVRCVPPNGQESKTALCNEGSPMSTTVRAVCPHDCPDTCGMVVTVEDGRAVKLRGDRRSSLHARLSVPEGHALSRTRLPPRAAQISPDARRPQGQRASFARI